jgi:hypothetical protein
MNEQLDQVNQPDQEVYASYHEVEIARKITIKDIQDHMTGPVISMICHAIVIALLGSIIIFDAPEERKVIEVEMKEVQIRPIEKPPEPPPPTEVTPETTEVVIDRPDVATEVDVKVDDAPVADAPIDVVIPNIIAITPSNSEIGRAHV